MGDLASDHDAAIELIIDYSRRLKSREPNHELLQYISDVTEDGFEFVEEKYSEFLDRFETPEDKKKENIKVAKVLASYFVALRDAVEERPVTKKPRPVEHSKTIEEMMKDIPF